MILKIGRYEVIGEDWWILDDIRIINYGLIKVDSKKVPENGSIPDITIMDYRDGNMSATSEISTIRAICRDSKGNEFSIEFDTLAYLCNDDGKTIEKIIANYNKRPGKPA